MLGKIESEDIVLEFDVPIPPRPVHFIQKEQIWWRRLRPLQNYPGRRARVLYGIKSSRGAMSRKQNIERGLRIHNDHDSWLVESRKDDDTATWGIWVTYNGVLTETEFLAREHDRAVRSATMKKAQMRNQAKRAEQLGVSRFNSSLRPPTIRGL